ncbi:MAG: leucine dehydrogenase [Zetaproteobacteria bacterium]|nr:leucine dehydrogenase [Pseudobdellovibrionaceae bacterium]
MTIFSNLTSMEHEQLVFCHDKSTGLKAIIAIHDTTLGPALGGCRMWNYETEEDAIQDVLRLSRGMTYKAAITGLNLGGGKSVIIGDPSMKSEALFKVFGRFIDSLNGRYITAEDVNMRVEDMEQVATETPYVSGVSSGSGDPSPITALGVYHGIRASVAHRLGKNDLKGLKIAVQGVGNVGTYLCELLHKDGVELFVADINNDRVANAKDKYGAKSASLDSIHKLDLDVFAPCALGAILNDKTIPELNTPIVAGGANNQLLHEEAHSKMLQELGILYAPDYVINAGGLVNVYQELKGYDEVGVRHQAEKIYHTLTSIYKEAAASGTTTILASNKIAEKRLEQARSIKVLGNGLDNQLWYKPNN